MQTLSFCFILTANNTVLVLAIGTPIVVLLVIIFIVIVIYIVHRGMLFIYLYPTSSVLFNESRHNENVCKCKETFLVSLKDTINMS